MGQVVSCFNDSDIVYAWEHNENAVVHECGVLNYYGCLNADDCCKALKTAGESYLLVLSICASITFAALLLSAYGAHRMNATLRSIDDVQNELRKESGQDATDARDNMFRAFDQSDLSIDMIRGQMRKSKRQQRIYLSAILGILSMLVAAAIAVPLTVDGAFGHYKTNDSPQAEGDCYLNTTNPSTSVLLSEVAISISPVDNLGENRTQQVAQYEDTLSRLTREFAFLQPRPPPLPGH